MSEPLCTFRLYPKFKQLVEVEQSEKPIAIKEIVSELPFLHYNTFQFIIKFLEKVSFHNEYNKMTIHNIATVFTPNIFRPQDLTPNDLIYAGHLVDVLKIMISQNEYIFGKGQEDEDLEPMDPMFAQILANEI